MKYPVNNSIGILRLRQRGLYYFITETKEGLMNISLLKKAVF